MKEESEHKAICNYLRMQYPKVIFLSDLSGVKMSIGLAKKIKNLKCDRGIPDLIILHPKFRFSGLIIEIKATDEVIYKKNGELRKSEHLEEQQDMINRLNKIGYCAKFGVGFDECKRIIDWYMELD